MFYQLYPAPFGRYPFWINGNAFDNQKRGMNLSVMGSNVPKLYHSNNLFDDWASSVARRKLADAGLGGLGGMKTTAHERLYLGLVVAHNLVRKSPR